MDHCGVDGVEGLNNEDSSSSRSSTPLERSPVADRNPSPPPDNDTTLGEEAKEDAIGETAYSKHWVFSTLTHLIQMVTDHSKGDSGTQMQLTEDEEEDLCRIWDMAMDKDVAVFLQEFKAADILLGVIAKSCSPRLTEICVGILGNIACFPDTCLSLAQNKDLCAVLLLLLGDTDPPTLLETTRLLVTSVSHKDVSPLWLERMKQQTSVCSNLCFIMCSSTNIDLLVKTGELVDKLFDLDEELMKDWLTSQPGEGDAHDEDCDEESRVDIASSLLEAAKQLRSESPEGLEVYLHALQLITTVDEGIQVFAVPGGVGCAVWDFLSEVVCEDLCQPDDPPVVLQEQKALLVHALAVLSALYACQDSRHSKADTYFHLVGTMLRVLQYQAENQHSDTEQEEEKDEQLQALIDTNIEFLSDILPHLSKDAVAELVKRGDLTEKSCLSAVDSLLPQNRQTVQHLLDMLSEAEPQLADIVRKRLLISETSS